MIRVIYEDSYLKIWSFPIFDRVQFLCHRDCKLLFVSELCMYYFFVRMFISFRTSLPLVFSMNMRRSSWTDHLLKNYLFHVYISSRIFHKASTILQFGDERSKVQAWVFNFLKNLLSSVQLTCLLFWFFMQSKIYFFSFKAS